MPDLPEGAEPVEPVDPAAAAPPAEPVPHEPPPSEAVPPESAPAPTPARRRRGIVLPLLLGIALLLALAAGGWLFWQLTQANAQIEQQQRELDERGDLIDQKEQFGAVMQRVADNVAELDGLPFASLVDWDRVDGLADRGWAHRWVATSLAYDIKDAERTAVELEELRAAAATQAATNATGSAWEATLDQLGSGYVTTLLEEADELCEDDVLACVGWDEPFVVHVDSDDSADESMNDWIRTGVAYHEFAHVLQATNPEPTEETLAVFGDDLERMADCYSLTYLPGWALEHKVWINSWSWWDVEVGYGYTCNETERQAIRDWNAKLGVVARPLGS